MATPQPMALATTDAEGLTARMAEFAIHTPYEALPDVVIEGVKRSQLDTWG